MRSVRAGACAAAVVGVLAACGSSSGGATSASSPTTGTSDTPTKSTPSTTTKPASSDAVSTVKGRAHDAGTIVATKSAGGLTVLVLDRWSVKGLSDSKLASDGVPVAPHTDTRYYDQNKGKTYTVPVNPSAPIVENECVKGPKGQPPTMTSTPVSLSSFLKSSKRSSTVVLLTYDDSGRLARLDTDPAC